LYFGGYKLKEQKTVNLTTTIHSLDTKGSGMALEYRDHGGDKPRKLKLNIPQTLIGEEVEVDVPNADGRRRAVVMPKKILTPHEERVTPPCPHFEMCGGCVWQHWQYEGQLKYKTDLVKSFLEQQDFNTSVVKDTIGMENPFEFRNKMEFTFSKEGHLGLHELGNFRNIIDLDTCLISSRDMVRVMKIVSDWAKDFDLPGYDKDSHTGLLRHLMVRQSQITGELMAALFATEAPEGALTEAVNALVIRLTSEIES